MQDESAENGKSAEELIADAESLLESGALDEEVQEQEYEEGDDETGDEVETQPAIKSEEDDDHSEKSRLGRKLKRLEQEQSRKEAELQAKLDRIESLLTRSVSQVEDPEPELSEYPTRDEILAREQWKDRQIEKRLMGQSQAEKAAIADYQKQYKELLDEIDPDEDPDLFSMLTDTKDTTYNLSHSGYKNAAKDFAKNLSAAQRALRMESKKPTPNVKGKSGSVATGVGVSSNKPTKTFDRDKYMKGLSRDERSIAEALSDSDLRRIFG